MKFGEKSQQEFSNTLYTGFGIFECILVNPSKKELASFKGYEIDETKEGFKDFEYESKDAQGNEFVDIVFYIQAISHEDKPIMPVRFRLIDKDVVSEKDGVTKYQFASQQGGTAWCDDEKNLLDKFKKVQVKGETIADRQIRKAIQGEGNLYNFLQAWLDKGVAFFGESSVDTDIFIDKKKAFRNIDKYVDSEIRPLIGKYLEISKLEKDIEELKEKNQTDATRKELEINSKKLLELQDEQKALPSGKFNALAMVGISEKDGKINHFQNVYNNFWPEWKFKSMVGAVTSGNWSATEELTKAHGYLVKALAKSAYTLGWLKVFSESEHLSTTNETFKSADTNDVSAEDTSY